MKVCAYFYIFPGKRRFKFQKMKQDKLKEKKKAAAKAGGKVSPMSGVY